MGFCLPRIVNAKRVLRASTDVPKGYFPVYVGENQKRFVIPVSYLNSPLFQDLLSLSEEEFGYDHPSGALRIPCVEAKAAVHALRFAADLGLQHIELEGDALYIACKLNSTASDLSVIRPLTEEAKQLVNSFRSHTVMHVRRPGNTAPAAHLLAKFGLTCNEPCFWIEECPDNIRNVVKSDMVHSH